MTQAAIVFAVAIGSYPEEVGVSVDPKRDTMSEMPAASYSERIEERSEAVNCSHS